MTFLLIGIFLMIVSVILFAVGLGSRVDESKRKTELARMLEDRKPETSGEQSTVLIEPAGAGGDVLAQALAGFDFSKKWTVMIQQAGLSWTPAQLVMSIAALALAGILLGLKLHVLLSAAL